MVLVYKSTHEYDYNFQTVSLAFFNRYPNPYATHVLSSDTVAVEMRDNKLYTTKLIRKAGRLPKFIKPFLGNAAETWIVEFAVVDPQAEVMETCTYNLDHTRVLKVTEKTAYQTTLLGGTMARYHVLFTSNFGKWGVKDRIENWSYARFHQNVMKSRRGMSFVMESLREKGINAFRQNTATAPTVNV